MSADDMFTGRPARRPATPTTPEGDIDWPKIKPAPATPVRGHPRDANEAAQRYGQRYALALLAEVLGVPVIDPPTTVDGWTELARITRELLKAREDERRRFFS